MDLAASTVAQAKLSSLPAENGVDPAAATHAEAASGRHKAFQGVLGTGPLLLWK